MAGSNSFFATSATHRCSISFSPFRDPRSAGTDAFSPVLGRPSGLRVPSGGCHQRILAKLRASTGTELTLVTLHWAQRPWFSDLVQLSLAPPVILPSRPALLRLLGLVISTRISVGSGFMPGDSPALSKSSWLLLHYSGAVLTGAPSILARSVSGTVVHLSWVVSLQWPFRF